MLRDPEGQNMRLQLVAASLFAIAAHFGVTPSAAQSSPANAASDPAQGPSSTSNSSGGGADAPPANASSDPAQGPSSNSRDKAAATRGFEQGDIRRPYVLGSTMNGNDGNAGSSGKKGAASPITGTPSSDVMFNPKEYSITKSGHGEPTGCPTPSGPSVDTRAACHHGQYHPDTHGAYHPDTHGAFHPDTHGAYHPDTQAQPDPKGSPQP
jgi:hypothetical protein